MDKGCTRRNLIFTGKFTVIHTSKGIILFDLDHAEDKEGRFHHAYSRGGRKPKEEEVQ